MLRGLTQFILYLATDCVCRRYVLCIISVYDMTTRFLWLCTRSPNRDYLFVISTLILHSSIISHICDLIYLIHCSCARIGRQKSPVGLINTFLFLSLFYFVSFLRKIHIYAQVDLAKVPMKNQQCGNDEILMKIIKKITRKKKIIEIEKI